LKYVIGVDLGTSAVKVLLVNQEGEVCQEASKSYPLIQEQSGYSEQDPEEWVEKTIGAIRELLTTSNVNPSQIEGMSFSGQMHGLVLLNREYKVIRNAILWNDTRTSKQCREIERGLGEQLLKITKNPASEGFTLPKLLWVIENEPQHFKECKVFMLPKDYVRYRLTGMIHSEYSDAAGTLLLDIAEKRWSSEVCQAFGIQESLCPHLVESHDLVGTILPEMAEKTGLQESTKVYAGGADNACGAIGAGILSSGKTLCSIGTSGVILSYEERKERDFRGKVHFFNHGKEDAFYTMGVTLAAGYSLSWFKDVFAKNNSFDELLNEVDQVPAGANGLLFTPYLVGERTPHADAHIRGSFIGIDSSHKKRDFVRAVIEGITFSLHESIQIFRNAGKRIDRVISIGGGAKNDTWLQIQADIFDATVVQLENEQGPGMGAAMLAAFGCGWFDSLEECAARFVKHKKEYRPQSEMVNRYHSLYNVYTQIYTQTREMNEQLSSFRR
jgi:xylulokinase